MRYSIDFKSNSDYLIVKIEDEIDLESFKAFAIDVSGALKKHHYSKVLYDLLSSSLKLNIVEIDEVPELLSQLGIDPSIKRAMVVSDDFKKYNFFQTTSHNKRLNVKIFKNYSEAKKWLLNDEQPASLDFPPTEISKTE